MLTDEFYWFWLCNIAGIGKSKINALVNNLGDAKAVYKAGIDTYAKIEGITEADVCRLHAGKTDRYIYESACNMERLGIHFVHKWHNSYPKKLLNIYDPPVALYYKGKLPDENIPAIAVVGARNCTQYGRHMAYELCKGFVKLGWQVISGLALGIDTAAHQGAIDGEGYTCGVLGCGVDICYPRSNIELYSDMVDKGCIISEYAVGTPPHAGQFPVRNRIISGLSDSVVVVEARAKSGSLITVEHALEQGKNVFAVPGRVGDALSEGCNWLLKMGAAVITEADDIMNDNIAADNTKTKALKQNIIVDKIVCDEPLNNSVSKRIKTSRDKKTQTNLLATEKNIVYSVLDLLPKSLEIIIEETGLDIAVVSEQLLCLQLEGLALEISKNCYSRV